MEHSFQAYPAAKQPVVRAEIERKEKHLPNLSFDAKKRLIFFNGEPNDKIIIIFKTYYDLANMFTTLLSL